MDYVIYRIGSNAANQPQTLGPVPVAVVRSIAGRTAHERYTAAVVAGNTLPWSVAGCWNNQHLTAKPLSRASAADRDAAYQHMQAADLCPCDSGAKILPSGMCVECYRDTMPYDDPPVTVAP